jgi:hypothetical protein
VKADLTRSTFDPLNNFSRVLMQQGRVQLDADWNEQADILLHMLRRLIADAFPAGGGSGFKLTPIGTKNVISNDFAIAPGSYYVGGVLCELGTSPVPVLSWSNKQLVVGRWTTDGIAFARDQYVQLVDVSKDTPQVLATTAITAVDYKQMTLTVDTDVTPGAGAKVTAHRLVTYKSQPFLPAPAALAPGSYQLYLDVWERVVTYLGDDAIREVALNGPDTAARTQVVWQLRTTPFTAPKVAVSNTSLGNSDARNKELAANPDFALPARKTCMTPQALANAFQPWNVGLMRARSQPAQISTDPCTIAPESTYRGENQLYRVEIHTGSAGGAKPSFKWSRENGSVVYPILKIAPGTGATTLTLSNLGRDDRFGLAEGDYAEIVDDRSELTNTPGPLLRVRSIDRGGQMVTLQGTTSFVFDPALHPLLRRWDHRAGDAAAGGEDVGEDGALPIETDRWVNLEDGVQVQFPLIDGASYRPGDYWLIVARVALGDIVWPKESGPDAQGNTVTNQLAKPPDGIVHRYAPLAVVTITDGAAPAITACQLPDGFSSGT